MYTSEAVLEGCTAVSEKGIPGVSPPGNFPRQQSGPPCAEGITSGSPL